MGMQQQERFCRSLKELTGRNENTCGSEHLTITSFFTILINKVASPGFSFWGRKRWESFSKIRIDYSAPVTWLMDVCWFIWCEETLLHAVSLVQLFPTLNNPLLVAGCAWNASLSCWEPCRIWTYCGRNSLSRDAQIWLLHQHWSFQCHVNL